MAAFLRRILLSDYFVFGLCVVYAAIVSPFTPGFLSASNWANILATLLPLLIVALGQTLVLIAGGIDLSATAVIGLTSIVGALAMNEETGWAARHVLATPLGILVMMGIGAGVGAFNGLAIAFVRMPPFMVTLASMMGLGGLAVWITHSQSINALPRSFTQLGSQPMLAFAIAAGVTVLTHGILSRSLWGRWLYATGQNAAAALISGVPVRAVVLAAYVASGMLAALASVLYTGQAETGSPVLGQRILLDVIGAVVIGGTSLQGGKGKVLWTLFGVLFLKLVDNSLNLLSLSLFTITMAKGAIILIAAWMDSLRSRLSSP